MTDLSLSGNAPSTLAVDALVIAVAPAAKEEERGRRRGGAGTAPTPLAVLGADDVVAAFGADRLAGAFRALGATGGAGEVTKVVSLGTIRAPLLVAVGLGDLPGPPAAGQAPGHDAEALRRAAGAAVRALAGTPKVALALPAPDATAVGAVAEGALLGAYAFDRYRVASADGRKPPVESVLLATPLARDKGVKAALDRARAVGVAVGTARDLVNTPPSDLHPQELADAAAAAAKGLPVDVTVLDEKALAKGGYGGILGVGQGSAHPPRLVKLAYRPRGAGRHLALVGKGITFDSGGLSLKPSASMEWMKSDMGGAAAVVCAVTAIARLGLPVAVTGWAPLAENMPSGTAQRPSDVLRIRGGKTVEVLNTDAEGRLVLADALVAAGEEHPDVIVDAATLTGAQLVALGSRTAAVMSNDDALREKVVAAAARAGEAMWPMPLPPELRKSMDSEVADIANMGDKYGGMLVAGLFLQEFVPEGVPWAHLDIAGPAFNQGEPFGYTPKGGTGAAVRTLVALAEDMAAGRL